MKSLIAFILFSSFLLGSSFAFAAACCGGSFATPSLISGDERLQLTSSLTLGEVKSDVTSRGIWSDRDEDREDLRTFKIEGASLFSDRTQLGVSTSFMQRERLGESSSGMGDTQVSLGYEYLTNWDYNLWKPKGIGYLDLVIPTGESIYEFDRPYGIDARGRGFWSLGLGTLLVKSFISWDFYTSLAAHYSLPREAQFEGENLKVTPGWSGNFALGGGYSVRSFRVGGGITWNYESPIKVESKDSAAGLRRFATAVASLSYMWNEDWANTLSYADQTVFGSPTNTTLSQSVIVQVQRRWAR